MRQVLVVGGAGGLGAAVVGSSPTSALPSRSRDGAGTDRRVRCARVIDATAVDWQELYASVEAEGGARLDGIVFVAGQGVWADRARPRRARPADVRAQLLGVHPRGDRGRAALGDDGRSGTFVAVLSIVARRAVPFEAHYAASKAAAARFVECLHLEHEGAGLRFVRLPGHAADPVPAAAEWFGLAPTGGGGADARWTARAIVAVLRGQRRSRVIGWRERVIDLADRVAPELYDRSVLRRRVLRTRA